MNLLSKITVLAGFSSLILFGCRPNQCNEDIPVIEFSEFQKLDDNSAKLILTFKDCDGDIGLNQADSVDPYKYNLFMEYFEKQNGVWVADTPLVPYYYRIPVLYDGTGDAVEGDIEVTMQYYYNPFSNYDTIKFQVHLMDRALNESNVVETGEIVKPN